MFPPHTCGFDIGRPTDSDGPTAAPALSFARPFSAARATDARDAPSLAFCPLFILHHPWPPSPRPLCVLWSPKYLVLWLSNWQYKKVLFTLDVLAYVTIVWSRREQCYATKSVTAVCHALPAVPICPSSLIGCLESARSETARGQTAAGGRRPWSGWPMGDGEPRRAQKNRPIYTLNIPGSARNARNPPLARFPPSRSHFHPRFFHS